MTSIRNILYLLLVLVITATSCNKDNTTPDTPVDNVDYQTIPFSITIGITPMNGSVNGVDLKQSFASGDVVEISNPQILYEPLIIKTTSFIGKTKFIYSGEVKIKKGEELTAGSTKLTAVLKNGTNYNNGKPFVDVQKVASLAQGLDQYSYWACENFTYNADATSINLVQNTVFVDVTLFGAKVAMKYGMAFYNEVVKGNYFYAVPSGTNIEIEGLGLDVNADGAKKSFYHIGAEVPDGCLPALFSVGENKFVFFSKGNLEYRPMDGEWCFAPQQYHQCFYSGDDLGDNYANWMGEDKWTNVFQFGAYLEGGNPCNTVNVENNNMALDANNNLSGSCAYGSDWTTLTESEWIYLLNQRYDAMQKRFGAVVNDVYGLVVLPDDWVTPEGLSFKTQYQVKYRKDIPNSFTIDEWALMESAGALFLPTGIKINTYFSLEFAYQSLTFDKSQNRAVVMSYNIFTNESGTEGYSISTGIPVRLVQVIGDNSKITVE